MARTKAETQTDEAPVSMYQFAKDEVDGYTLIPFGIDNPSVELTDEVVDHTIEGASYRMVVAKRK